MVVKEGRLSCEEGGAGVRVRDTGAKVEEHRDYAVPASDWPCG